MIRFILLLGLWLTACTATPTPSLIASPESSSETAIQVLNLAGDAADSRREFSGMAWHGDQLILLPQYPDDRVYSIPKTTLLDAITNPSEDTITAQTIAFADHTTRVSGFQGYEAIAIIHDQVYLTIEAGLFRMSSYIVSGTIDAANGIQIVGEPLQIPQPVQIFNASHEALVAHENRLIALYERNALIENAFPEIVIWEADTITTQPFINLPYRITDATPSDANGRFWVVNYLYPDETQRTEDDPFARYNQQGTHGSYEHLERLVEIEITDDGSLVLTDTMPIYLELSPDARNWEGIVRLDDLGFLIITDKHPDTILAFVPLP